MISVDDPRFGLAGGATKPEASPANTPSREAPGPCEEALADTFDQLLREVIRPEMESAGIGLERRQYEYEIIIEPGHQITMRMCPPLPEEGPHRGACPVYVRFTRDASSTAVHVVQGAIGADETDGAAITCTMPVLRVTRPEVARLIADTLKTAGRGVPHEVQTDK